MSMNQFKEQFIKNLTHEELITEYEAKFALCEHLEDEVQRLSRERSKLAEEVVSLEVKLNTSEAKLSEFQEGIPIEKAKTEEQYFRIDEYGYPALVECSDADGCWYVRISDQDFDLVQSGPLYLLPSQTQEQINEQ